MSYLSRLWAVAVVAAALTGCSNSGLNSVSGTVTMDGQPYGDVLVTFNPVDGSGGAIATGTADSGGHFRMGTFGPGDGVKPGKYKVTVAPLNKEAKPAGHPSEMFSKKQQESPDAKLTQKEYTKAEAEATKAAKKAPPPPVYADFTKTPFSADVPAQTDIKLELSSTAK